MQTITFIFIIMMDNFLCLLKIDIETADYLDKSQRPGGRSNTRMNSLWPLEFWIAPQK
jgi:hypothetical protein